VALAGYDRLQLGLEAERLKTRGTVIEVTLYLFASLRRQLPVQEGVQGGNSFLAGLVVALFAQDLAMVVTFVACAPATKTVPRSAARART
jgi:hypothetical protein